MIEKRKHYPFCADCIYLYKGIKITYDDVNSYRYGCTFPEGNGETVGAMRKDFELKTMGCSNSNKVLQGTLLKINDKYIVMYCGKVKGGRLLHNRQLHTYKVVSDDWFKKVKVTACCVSQRQFEACQRMAKKRKRKWINEHR